MIEVAVQSYRSVNFLRVGNVSRVCTRRPERCVAMMHFRQKRNFFVNLTYRRKYYEDVVYGFSFLCPLTGLRHIHELMER